MSDCDLEKELIQAAESRTNNGGCGKLNGCTDPMRWCQRRQGEVTSFEIGGWILPRIDDRKRSIDLPEACVNSRSSAISNGRRMDAFKEEQHPFRIVIVLRCG
jgi:hypothetical protein